VSVVFVTPYLQDTQAQALPCHKQTTRDSSPAEQNRVKAPKAAQRRSPVPRSEERLSNETITRTAACSRRRMGP
jgi:hypothetical protein